MNRCLLLLSVLFFSTLSVLAQPAGKVIETRTIKSAILGKLVKYSIYLPADYDASERTYPVVYLLHGYTDDNTGWVQYGQINRLADKAIADGTIPPMIIIMPNGDSSFYVNSYDGKEKYEDFFIREFIPTVEKAFRIKSEKRYRGIAGLSMGGYGTLIYLLKYPQFFTAGAALSAAVWSDEAIKEMEPGDYDGWLGKLYGLHLTGDARLTESYQQHSILHLVENKPAAELKQVRYWIDCGDKDFLTVGNSLLHIALTKKEVPHEFRMREGAHTWKYWRSGIIDGLSFIGTSFAQ